MPSFAFKLVHVRSFPNHMSCEGMQVTKTRWQVSILGTPAAGVSTRMRAASVGVADNFAHLRGRGSTQVFEAPLYGNRSQISLG